MEDMNSSSISISLTNAVTGTGNDGGEEKVRLQLYAQGLPNVSSGGTLSRRRANPFAVVTVLANDPNENRYILGMTEVIKRSYNPRWVTSFDLNYDSRRNDIISIGIYDEVKPNNEVIIGSAMFKVGDVLGSKGNIKGRRLVKGGSIFARITPAPTVQDHVLTLCFHGIHIKNIEGIFGIADPFFELTSQITSICGNSKSWQPVYRSKRIDNDLNPKWEQFTINTKTLCDGDYNKPIQFVLWDSNKKGKHTFMGSFQTSLNGLLSKVNNTSSSNNTYNNTFTVRQDGKAFGRIIVVTAQINDGNMISINNNNNHHNSNNIASVIIPPPLPPLPPPQMSSSISNVAPIPTLDTTNSSSNTITSYTSYNLPPFSEALAYPIPPPEQEQQQKQSSQPLPSSSFQNDGNTTHAPNYYSKSFISNDDTPRPYQQSPSEQLSQSVVCRQLRSSSYQIQPIIPLPIVPPKRPKFIEYLTGGRELELSIAIDYTSSSDDPRIPGKLHYIHPDGTLNDYEKAIAAVGSVIARYDTDQKFPVIAFGAKYNSLIKYCFQVGNTSELNGLLNVLHAYRKVFHTGVTMSSVTVREMIDYTAAAAARSSKHGQSQRIGQQSYRILFVLADGAFTDADEQTKRSIINANDVPLSIVLVGIGTTADITAMNFLDIFRTMMVVVVVVVVVVVYANLIH